MLKIFTERELNEDVIENNEPVNNEIIEKAFEFSANSLIQQLWDLIANVNSAIANIEYDYKDESKKDDIKNILNNIVDDLTIDVGMLNSVSNLISYDRDELITQGEEKAQEIIKSE